MSYRSMTRLLCLTLGLALAATCRPARAVDYDWTGSVDGIFNTAGNWSPTGGPPGSSDTAFFTLSPTYTVSFSADVTNDYLEQHDGDVTFDLGTNTYTLSSDAYLARSAGQSSRLTITNGTVSPARTYLGYDGTANGGLTVSTGGTWTNSGYLYVGRSGTGALNIQNGGAVSNSSGFLGYYAGSNGTATVDGTGSTWTNSGNLYVGRASTGSLTIQNGGAVSNSLGWVGDRSGSDGTVTVDGTGSTWSNSVDLLVGYNGTGALTIQNGGAVSNRDGNLGIMLGSSGAATVAGTGSTWTNSRDLYVGWYGTGALTIQNGGAVSSTGGDIAYYADSSGTATVAGTGSTWTNTGSLYVGGYSLSAGGIGSLDVNSGGSVNVADTMKIWNTGSVEVTNGSISAAAIQNAGSLTNNGTISGSVTNQSGGLLSGSGTFLDAVTIADGSTVSPGASPGTMAWGSGLLEGGGSLFLEINDATGAIGADPGWDRLSMTGGLDITATAGNPFVLEMISLTLANIAGDAANFDNLQPYGWTFLTAGGGITGFSADYFLLDYSGFQNDLGGGSFFISQVGNSLNVNFAAVPEPSTLALLGTGLITAVLAYRRRRRAR